MKINYSKDVDAVYIRFNSSKIDHTDAISDECIIDYDVSGAIVGLEVLDASRHAQLNELIIQAFSNVVIQNTVG